VISELVREQLQGFDDFLDEIVGIREFVGFFKVTDVDSDLLGI